MDALVRRMGIARIAGERAFDQPGPGGHFAGFDVSPTQIAEKPPVVTPVWRQFLEQRQLRLVMIEPPAEAEQPKDAERQREAKHPAGTQRHACRPAPMPQSRSLRRRARSCRCAVALWPRRRCAAPLPEPLPPSPRAFGAEAAASGHARRGRAQNRDRPRERAPAVLRPRYSPTTGGRPPPHSRRLLRRRPR